MNATAKIRNRVHALPTNTLRTIVATTKALALAGDEDCRIIYAIAAAELAKR